MQNKSRGFSIKSKAICQPLPSISISHFALAVEPRNSWRQSALAAWNFSRPATFHTLVRLSQHSSISTLSLRRQVSPSLTAIHAIRNFNTATFLNHSQPYSHGPVLAIDSLLLWVIPTAGKGFQMRLCKGQFPQISSAFVRGNSCDFSQFVVSSPSGRRQRLGASPRPVPCYSRPLLAQVGHCAEASRATNRGFGTPV